MDAVGTKVSRTSSPELSTTSRASSNKTSSPPPFKEVTATSLKTIQTELSDAHTLADYQSTVAPIFRQQYTLEQQSHHLGQLRDWILRLLMNGQVRVTWREISQSLPLLLLTSHAASKGHGSQQFRND